MNDQERHRRKIQIVIPWVVWSDSRLTWMEKCLFGEVSSLDGKRGACWASNQYIADHMGSTKKSISNMISNLEKLGYFKVQFDGSERLISARLPIHPEVEGVSTQEWIGIHPGVDSPPPPHIKDRSTNDNKETTVEIPKNLDTPEFRESWESWIQYRKSKKKPLVDQTKAKTLKALSGFGVEWSIARIEKAMINGWQGLIFDNDLKANSGTATPHCSAAAPLWKRIQRLEEQIERHPSNGSGSYFWRIRGTADPGPSGRAELDKLCRELEKLKHEEGGL